MSIYKKMVAGEGDMIGHIAYSRYIAEKIVYIESYKENNNVDTVPQNEIERYEDFIGSDNIIEKYRFRATSILQKFLQNSFNKTSEEFLDVIKKGVSQHIEEEIAPQIEKVNKEISKQIEEEIVPQIEEVNKEISDQIKKDIQASFDVTFKEFTEKINKEISDQIKKDITPNLPPKEPRWKRVVWGSVHSMCGACLVYFFIWFFTNIAGRYSIGDISIEIKHNGKQAQQEQVVQPKQNKQINQ